jgi:signal transduction histidine kinase
MTNVIKHAAPTSARVVVRYLPEAVELAVVDTGPGESRTQHRDDGSGHGLVGMHERVAMFGGTLHAGPRAAGGFEVTARLPRAEVSTS